MDDAQLRRYSRHLLLPEIDLPGQKKLIDSRVLLFGLGGLGSPVAIYLAASGVGNLVLCDHDVVELSNLQRQILHKDKDINRSKVSSAAETVQALNPDVNVITIPTVLTGKSINEEVARADIVIDTTDNFHSRHAINEACFSQNTPLISGSVIRMAGQVTSFRFDQSPSPCYNCLYSDEGDIQETCSQSGILAPLAGVIGSLQAIEALKILLNFGETLQGRLLQVDALTMAWRMSTLKGDPACTICSSPPHKKTPLEYQAVSS
jgi:molybdopterin-synthase adenylyltransferase